MDPNWISSIIAGLAIVVASMSYAHSSATARAQIYLEFRRRFSEFKDEIPHWYDHARIPEEATKDEKRALELYWQNAYDEWFVTQELHPHYLGKLWRGFYRGILKGALRHGVLRQVADELTGPSSSEFGDQKARFRHTLDELCRKGDGTRIDQPPASANPDD